jgi:hypothetical protein
MNHFQSPDDFYAGAYARIVRMLCFFVPGFALALWFAYNHRFALGFLAGGAIAVFNFLVLKKLVIAFADRVIATGDAHRSSGLVLRFLLRYTLMAGIAYAIFKSSAMSAYGLLCGLAAPALAIMTEAAYELYGSMRRGY